MKINVYAPGDISCAGSDDDNIEQIENKMLTKSKLRCISTSCCHRYQSSDCSTITRGVPLSRKGSNLTKMSLPFSAGDVMICLKKIMSQNNLKQYLMYSRTTKCFILTKRRRQIVSVAD